jgi:hypothetical protein
MSTITENIRTGNTLQALVQLLKGRSYEEIRQRMYDNPPGSPWWSACKAELDVRNAERMSTALVDTARVLDKMKLSAEHLDSSTDKLLDSTTKISDILQHAKELGRKMEIAAYVMVAVTILQLFYAAFQVFGKR